jgi:hypothetical protein
MDEIEVPLEKVQEDILEHVHGHGHGEHKPSMMNFAAILSALLAVAAAVSALFAGHFANDAMIEQIQAGDHWAYYQAKGIKLALAESRALDHDSSELQAKISKYKSDQDEIKSLAEEKVAESEGHLRRHEKLAAAVTFFQVAIALTAIAVLTRKRRFLFVASGLGAIGLAWSAFSFFI